MSDNEWFQNSKYPPSGEKCQFKATAIAREHVDFASEWEDCTIIYSGVNGVVLLKGNGEECLIDSCNYTLSFKPIGTKRDAMIKSLMTTPMAHTGLSRCMSEQIVDAGWMPVKRQTESEFVDYFEEYQDRFYPVDAELAVKMYRSGLRFVGSFNE